MEDLITAGFVNRWEPQSSPVGGPGDASWGCCGPESWRTWLAVHQGGGIGVVGDQGNSLEHCENCTILSNQQIPF